MIKKFASLVFGLVSFCALAQNKSSENQVVLKLNDSPIYLSEFEQVFKKNNDTPDTSPEGLNEYMDLFVKYKLKVAEAEALGMDTLANFKRELSGYRRQLAAPYLTDQEAQEELVKEAYEHLKYEINASHILLKIKGAGYTSEDTLEAYNKAIALKKRILDGEKFETLAVKYSEDPSAKNNKGVLGYFSGMQMVWPFEQAAFNTEVGGVTGPIKTSFGYHLIKVNDKRPTQGTVRAAHILIKTDKDAALAEQKINELYAKLQAGEDFKELAKKYSEDGNTANKGGELAVFGTGKMVEEFEAVAFALEKPGEYSKPVKTQFGWHIIQLLEKLPLPEYNKIKGSIINRIKRDSRSKVAKQAFVNRLKKEYNHKMVPKNYNKFYSWINDDVFEGKWEVPSAAKEKYIATYADTGVTQLEFALYINSLQRKALKEDKKYFIDKLYERLLEIVIVEYEDAHLEEKYPDFAALMREYRDGILLFDLMNKMVWNKAIEDTTGLKNYFASHQNQFVWNDRADVTLYKSENKKLLEKVGKKLKKGWNEAQILEAFTTDENNLVLTSEHMVNEANEKDVLTTFEWKKGLSEIKRHNDRYTLAYFHEIIPAGPKTLDEAKGAAIAAYQNYLEEEWIKELRSKYKVEINEKVLYSLQ